MISIIIPTKNEPGIQKLIDGVNSVMENHQHEIIVVDKNDIRPALFGAQLLIQQGDGLGQAFLEGFGKAKGDVIVLMDGDGSHRPEDLPKLINALGDAEMAVGSKFVEGGKTEDAMSRRMVSRAFSVLARVITGAKVRDPMTGFMAVRRNVIVRTRLNPKGYKVVLELLYKSKAKVKEVPILFKERAIGKSKVGFNIRGLKEALGTVRLMLSLRLGN